MANTNISGNRRPILLNDTEAAELLGVSPATLRVWRCTKRYQIPYIKLGRHVRYREADLIAWIDSRECGGEAE